MKKLFLALIAMGMMTATVSASTMTQDNKPVPEKKACCKEKKQCAEAKKAACKDNKKCADAPEKKACCKEKKQCAEAKKAACKDNKKCCKAEKPQPKK